MRIALVGAGYMAAEHAKAFASIADVEIVGVCGRSRARTDALALTYKARAFPSIAEMYNATTADAVVVAVPELAMAEVCFASFRHPWVCLLEKPVGVDLAQAETILAASKTAGARAYVALNRRSYASTRQAIRELAKDHSPRLISVLDQQDMKAAHEMGQPAEVVRNYMYANSIHLVDYLSLFGRGPVARVEITVPWDARAPGFVAATVHFASGDTGTYQAVWDGPGPWAVSITNTSMRLEMRPLEKFGIQRRGERRLTEAPADPIDTDYKPGLRHQAEQIVQLLRGGAANLATLDDATASMRLCADIYRLKPSCPI